MKKLTTGSLVIVILILVLFTPTSLYAQGPLSTPTIPKQQILSPAIDAIAKTYMNQDGHDMGIAIGVIEVASPHAPLYSAGFYGTISKDSKQIPHGNALFEIGSTSKVFTATLLAFLITEGKVKLSDPIQKYLPDGVQSPTYQGQAITLLDLATHRSGLPDSPGNKPKDPMQPYTVQDMYNWLDKFKLTRAPGSQWEYSNIGFGLLGTLLSGIVGEPYDQQIVHYIGIPLAMPDTVLFPSDEQKTRLAMGYDTTGQPAIQFYKREGGPQLREQNGIAGGGQLYSTLNDMLQFAAANLDLIGDQRTLQAFDLTQEIAADGQGKQDKMGLGWELTATDSTTNVRRIWKNGATLGFQSYITFYKSSNVKYAVVVLGNGRSENMFDQVGVDIMKLLINAKG